MRSLSLSRRRFLLGSAFAATGTLVTRRDASAAGTRPHRIDVHTHFSPPAYVSELDPKNLIAPQTRDWTAAKALDAMDKGGVATSIASITTPGLWFGDNASARRLARLCNEYAARLVSDYPGRFGFWVALPLPDIDGSLREIEYGLDVLKADGVGMFTSYGGKWLGDPAFDPVFEELHRRKTVVYTHPTSPACCTSIVPGVPDPNIEYGTDTTRAIARMIFGGAAARFTNVRMIFSHAGGSMPFMIERFVNLAKAPEFTSQLPGGFLGEARKFFYDTAATSNAAAMSALRNVVPVTQIVFGTDFPFGTAAGDVVGLKQSRVFSAGELKRIDRENALGLLPKYGVVRT